MLMLYMQMLRVLLTCAVAVVTDDVYAVLLTCVVAEVTDADA